MNNEHFPYDKIEANLERLRDRIPDLPVASVLLSRLLLHLGRDLSTLMDQKIRPSGLAEVEFRVLATLLSQPDGVAFPGELCERTSQRPANMSRISDALLAHDLITRVSSVRDRRKMVLRITPQGEALVRRLLPTLYAPLLEMLEDFPEHEQQQLIGQLKRLGSKMDAAMMRGAPARSGPERTA